MNKIQKGKRNLMIISIILNLLSVGLLVGGVFLSIYAGKGMPEATAIVALVFAILFFILSLVGIVISLMMFWVACVMKATTGNIEESNEIAKKTIGSTKCPRCGWQVKDDEATCSHCGLEIERK